MYAYCCGSVLMCAHRKFTCSHCVLLFMLIVVLASMLIYMCVLVSAYIHACIRAYPHVCVPISMLVSVLIHMYVCLYPCLYPCLSTCMCSYAPQVQNPQICFSLLCLVHTKYGSISWRRQNGYKECELEFA